MQRKAYVPGVAVLLAAVLAACTGSHESDTPDDARPDNTPTTVSTAQPGRYDTLPEPCGAVDHGTLDSLLPGIRQRTDGATRDQAYEGVATPTYDTDRKVGCRWKVESSSATDYLLVDFERVVSYDNAVSDDSKAQEVYGTKVAEADLPEPTPSQSGKDAPTPLESASASKSTSPSPNDPDPSASSGSPSSSGSSISDPSAPSPSETPPSLLPRTLDGVGDEAFLDDALGTSGQRTITVVFRTSNVIVTVEYEEQPATTTDVPDSKEMQDRARNLAERLADSFDD